MGKENSEGDRFCARSASPGPPPEERWLFRELGCFLPLTRFRGEGSTCEVDFPAGAGEDWWG